VFFEQAKHDISTHTASLHGVDWSSGAGVERG
jgi:hypothetical protein